MKRDAIIAFVVLAIFGYLVWKASSSAALTSGSTAGS